MFSVSCNFNMVFNKKIMAKFDGADCEGEEGVLHATV